MLTRIDGSEAQKQLIKSVEKGLRVVGGAIWSGPERQSTQNAELDVYAPS